MLTLILGSALLLVAGCSGGSSPVAPSATGAGVAVGAGTQPVQAACDARRVQTRLTEVEGTIILESKPGNRRRTALIHISHGVWDCTDIVFIVTGIGTATLDVRGDGRVMGFSLNFEEFTFAHSGESFTIHNGRGHFRLPINVSIDDIISAPTMFGGATGLLIPAVQ